MRFLYNSYQKPKKSNGILIFYFLLSILMFCLVLFQTSCTTVKYIPVKGEDKIIIKDSIIRVKDTVTIEIPKEIIKTVNPVIEPSSLETSVAKSKAYVEGNKLIHTLENKPTTKAPIDTCFIVKYVDKIKTEVVIEEVEVPYISNWCWFLLVGAIGNVIWLFMKFR